jgi:predicted secreted hydrolase
MKQRAGTCAALTRFLALTLLLGLAGCDRDRDDATQPAALRVDAVLGPGTADDQGFERATDVVPFRFPGDHAAHPGYRSEWWYLTLVLTDDEGRDYGVQFTLFRQALAAVSTSAADGDPWRSGQLFMGHLALSDVAARRHIARERFARAHPALAGVQAVPFAAWLDGWRLYTVAEEGYAPPPVVVRTNDDETARERAVAMLLPLRLEAAADTFSVDVTIDAARPLVLQGERGLSAKGPGQASYYFSVPRMRVDGTVTVDGRARAVSGLGWYDREWSTSVLSPSQVGWDWFALRLTDGTDLMVFQLRRDDGARDPYDAGIVVTGDTAVPLAAADFTLQPERWWRDERGSQWPVRWRLERIGAEPLTIQAAFPEQQMDLSIRYWEGLVYVHDDAGRLVGRGYMELTGY